MSVNEAFINEFEKLAVNKNVIRTIGQIGTLALAGGALGGLPTVRRVWREEEAPTGRGLAEVGIGALLGTALGVTPKVWKSIQAKKGLAGLPGAGPIFSRTGAGNVNLGAELANLSKTEKAMKKTKEVQQAYLKSLKEQGIINKSELDKLDKQVDDLIGRIQSLPTPSGFGRLR